MGLHSCYSDKICGWLWMNFWWCIQYIYVAYMVIFIRTRRSTKIEYTTSLFDDEPLISFMLMSSCLQRCINFIWCRIPIVPGSHMVKDCWCWWYQESLTNDYELMVCLIHMAIYLMDTHYVGYMDDYLSCILLNIVGWPREWCYCRSHEDIAIWRHGYSETWLT